MYPPDAVVDVASSTWQPPLPAFAVPPPLPQLLARKGWTSVLKLTVDGRVQPGGTTTLASPPPVIPWPASGAALDPLLPLELAASGAEDPAELAPDTADAVDAPPASGSCVGSPLPLAGAPVDPRSLDPAVADPELAATLEPSRLDATLLADPPAAVELPCAVVPPEPDVDPLPADPPPEELQAAKKPAPRATPKQTRDENGDRFMRQTFYEEGPAASTCVHTPPAWSQRAIVRIVTYKPRSTRKKAKNVVPRALSGAK